MCPWAMCQAHLRRMLSEFQLELTLHLEKLRCVLRLHLTAFLRPCNEN